MSLARYSNHNTHALIEAPDHGNSLLLSRPDRRRLMRVLSGLRCNRCNYLNIAVVSNIHPVLRR